MSTPSPHIHERFLAVVQRATDKLRDGTLPPPRRPVTSRYKLRDVGKAGMLHENYPDEHQGGRYQRPAPKR